MECFVEVIEFDYVDFVYDKDLVVKDFNFMIVGGIIVVLVGWLGVGKMMIIDFVVCFYDFISGVICFNGIDLWLLMK